MSKNNRWALLALLFILAVVELYLLATTRSSSLKNGQQAMTCDMGISSSRQNREAQRDRVAGDAANGKDTVPPLNEHRPSASDPDGMVWIPGGESWMGADEFSDAQPWHRVHIDGFWMDRTEVANEQFAKFVKATGYVTMAERPPRTEDFPGATPEMCGPDRWSSRPPLIRLS